MLWTVWNAEFVPMYVLQNGRWSNISAELKLKSTQCAEQANNRET